MCAKAIVCTLGSRPVSSSEAYPGKWHPLLGQVIPQLKMLPVDWLHAKAENQAHPGEGRPLLGQVEGEVGEAGDHDGLDAWALQHLFQAPHVRGRAAGGKLQQPAASRFCFGVETNT